MVIELPIIKSGLSIGLINIKALTVSTEEANLVKFTCNSNIDCCSNLTIPVTEYDIERIQREGFELDQIIESLSPNLLPLKTLNGKPEKVYLLKRKPFDRTCTFLEDNQCKIHKFKPFACKTYPFTLDIVDEERIKILIHTESLCKSIIPGSLINADNQKLLKNILNDVVDEMKQRKIPI